MSSAGFHYTVDEENPESNREMTKVWSLISNFIMPTIYHYKQLVGGIRFYILVKSDFIEINIFVVAWPNTLNTLLYIKWHSSLNLFLNLLIICTNMNTK